MDNSYTNMLRQAIRKAEKGPQIFKMWEEAEGKSRVLY